MSKDEFEESVAFTTLSMAVAELRARIEALERRVDAKRNAVSRWEPLLREGRRLVFVSQDGETVRIPHALAVLLAEERPFDGRVRDVAGVLRFERGGKVIARIPTSLVRQLRGILGVAPMEGDSSGISSRSRRPAWDAEPTGGDR